MWKLYGSGCIKTDSLVQDIRDVLFFIFIVFVFLVTFFGSSCVFVIENLSDSLVAESFLYFSIGIVFVKPCSL